MLSCAISGLHLSGYSDQLTDAEVPVFSPVDEEHDHTQGIFINSRACSELDEREIEFELTSVPYFFLDLISFMKSENWNLYQTRIETEIDVMKRKLEETARLIQSQKEQKKREAKSRTQSDVR